MKQFDLYQHASKELQAVKVGFSWPAFFFPFIWTFVKGLWVHGFWLLAALITISAAIAAPVANIVMLALNIFVGFRANDWRRTELWLKYGYRPLRRVEAESIDLALAAGSGLRCPECDKPYRLSDYRGDAERIYCSFCESELPRDEPGAA